MKGRRGIDVLTGRVLLVGNPVSGSGAAEAWLQPIANKLRSRGASVELLRTGGPGEAREAAARCAGDADIILVMGGDGTVREVLNGAEPGQCCVGVLPTGAGNVLAGELGLSGRPDSDLERLLAGRVVNFDLGVCNGERFAAVFGAGIDAEVVRRVEQKRERHMSQLGYVPPLLRLTANLPEWNLRVSLDNGEPVDGGNVVVAGNTANYGGPVRFTPLADPRDGLFDVALTRLNSLFDLPAAALAMPLRRAHALGRMRYVRARSLTVTSTAPVPYQLDGDFAGWLPARVRCLPGAGRLLAPPGFSAAAERRGASRRP